MDSVDRRRFGCRRFRSQLVHPITLSIIATGYSCFVSDPRTFSGRNGIADFPIGAGKGRPTRSKPRSGVSPKTLAPYRRCESLQPKTDAPTPFRQQEMGILRRLLVRLYPKTGR